MRKSLVALTLAVALLGCSTTDTNPVDAETTVLPGGVDEPSLSSDPFIGTDAPSVADAAPPLEEAPTDASPFADLGSESMATPVEPPSGTEIPDEFLAEPSSAEEIGMPAQRDSVSDSLPPVAPAPEPDPLLAEPTPPEAPMPPPPMPEPSAPAVSAAPPPAPLPSSPPPPVVAGPQPSGRNVRQDYKEYQDRVQARSQAEEEYESRTLFPHEDGAFQFGMDFAYEPFPDFDFDPGTGVKTAENMGGMLSLTYFPVRSLTYGRLGVGGQVAAYWSKFSFNPGTATEETSRKHSIDTLGGKLSYEFQYFLGQVLVPFAFYGYEQVKVRSFSLASAGVNYPSRSFNSSIYGAGAHINLNRLESSAASKALATSGIRKFYLTYTLQQRSENTGAGHYLGLRFEY